MDSFDSWDSVDVAAFRALQRKRPSTPYERLADSDRLNQSGDAMQIISDGWALPDFPRISVTPPISWELVAAGNRSWEYRLHSWDFLGPALCALDVEANESLLEFVVNVAVDWTLAHWDLEVPTRMAWYDMAVAKRSYRLAMVLDLATRSPVVADSIVDHLLHAVRVHQIALAREGTFNPGSNHGFYVAAGQKAMSRRLTLLPGMEQQCSQSDERLRQMLSTQFSTEGVHREHSPDYHRMILSTLQQLERAELLPSDTSVNTQSIEESLAWFVLPDQSLAMFGDTPLRTLPNRNHYRSPVLQSAASGGRLGCPPDKSWRAFPESGYAVYRSGWPTSDDDPQDWTYLALNAAFHSRTHKHADDLSFVWYDHRSHILTDPGRFGYLDPTHADSDLGKKGFYYAHPKRIYIEETRAHNAVEIDGQSYQRRGVKPYGSALRRTGEHQGVFFAEAHAEHLTLDRSSRIQHTRLLLLRAREWLIVYDRLWDPRNRPHEFRQWFQFAPHLQVESDDLGWSMTGENGWRLWGLPLLEGSGSQVMRGETEPELQGWISYRDNELEPTPSVCVTASGTALSIATLFCFSDQPPVPGMSTATDQRASLSWSTSRNFDLSIHLAEDEDIELDLVVG